MQSAHVWHLKKGSEKKFRSGHPWVFSNELAQSPKGVPAGEPIELRDHQGSFLAHGYGHPNSLISFRTLSVRKDDVVGARFLADKLARAARLRGLAGLDGFSHRLCFAEGDGLPGLVIDRFRLVEPHGQVFIVQSSTAGMDRMLPRVLEALEFLVRDEHQQDSARDSWDRTAIVVANDSKSRAMEGIAVEPKRLERPLAGFNPEAALISIQSGHEGSPPLEFQVDFIGGQKTGFFLDQRVNVQLASRFVSGLIASGKGRRTLRVLDLCCYVGQWGAQLARLAKAHGIEAEVSCVDASARALQLAVGNVERNGGRAQALKLDVLDELSRVENRAFDVVICDPPAFIKKKKDLPTGSQAYFKMNREAVRKVASGGFFVSCSCSGLFGEEDFRSMLARVAAAYGGEIRWLARGGHSPDHPQRPEFPQGTYLKSWIGVMP